MNHMKRKTSIAIIALAVTLIGCTTTRVTPVATETPPGSGIFTTNNVSTVVVDPKLTAALETIGTVNAATSAVNPYSAPIGISLTAIAAIASWIAKRKNDALSSTTAQLKATVQGVENLTDSTAAKDSIQKQAIILGIEPALNSTVQQINNGHI